MGQISARLQRIADQVPAGVKAADIGTDHGFLPIYLVQHKGAPSVVASDIRRGPLDAARKNIHAAGLEPVIDIRLGSGLKTLQPGEVHAAVIAGMGGKTMTEILEESSEVVLTLKTLVLQPMGASRLVRKYLHDHHFHIQYETVFYDVDRTYELITAVPESRSVQTGSDDYADYNDLCSLELAYEFGPYLLKYPTAALLDAVREAVRRWKQAAIGLHNARNQEAATQREWVEQRIAWMENWLAQSLEKSTPEID
ncbi:class I SAM-dependent methyltransferase [Alicyclobacillus sp. SO9]|uniref:tRNA (adenine(22)-N(1))-methyltransferase n=1 Tax=Alicyclobacillus sp. SO9 TaxID=2665646 RepID=UPI0018E7B7CF|nr:class I SAM-dependent methyltransferase [Alicyclobacillus sp. SO9]QQE77324.1 SAM-dependent methyltransferase [Alicyclobacillus sp. SO9]